MAVRAWGWCLIAIKPCNKKEHLKRESLISLGYSQGPEGISNMAICLSVLAAVSGPNDTQSCGPPWTEFLSRSYLTLDWGPHFVNKLSMHFSELKIGPAPGASSTKVRKGMRDLGLSGGQLGESFPLHPLCSWHSRAWQCTFLTSSPATDARLVNIVYALCFWPLSDSESESCSVLLGLNSLCNFLGQNTGGGSFSLLQGISPTQGSNPGLLHCRWILYQLSHKGSPRILEGVAYPFSSGSSRPRNWIRVFCIASGLYQLSYQKSLFSDSRTDVKSKKSVTLNSYS